MPERPSPVLSIVIPAYNRADALGELLALLLAQVDHRHEIIVVDDGSNDGTPALLAELSSRHSGVLRCLEQTNRGATVARNAGLAAAAGRYTVFVDSDDLPERRWLTVIGERVSREPDVITLGAWADAGRVRELRLPRPEAKDPHRGILWLAGCLIVRTELLRAVGGYTEGLPALQNEDLLTRVLVARRPDGGDLSVDYVTEPLLHYRRALLPGSISADHSRRRRAIEAFLQSPDHRALYGAGWRSQVGRFHRQAAHLATLDGARRSALAHAVQGLAAAPSATGAKAVIKALIPRVLTNLPSRAVASARARREGLLRRIPGRYSICCRALRRRHAGAPVPRLARLMWANSWAATDSYIGFAQRLIAGGAYKGVLECGSGLTTLALSRDAAAANLDYVCLEQSPEWCSRVNRLLRATGSPLQATLAPLREYDSYTWYEREGWSLGAAPVLALCDGPPSAIAGNRDGLVYELDRLGLLSPGTTILFDDVQRPKEWQTVERWRVDFPQLELRFVEDRAARAFAVLTVT